MIKLKDILEILPKYDKNNSYGKKGEIKNSVRFYYKGEKSILQELRFKDLDNNLINNLAVRKISSSSSCGNGHSSSYLMILCEKIGE